MLFGAALAALAVLLLAVAANGAARKAAPVPAGFVGVDVDGPVVGPGAPVGLDSQLGTMVSSGVQTIRVAFSWSSAQPYESVSQVPAAQQSQYADVDGRPTDFQATDAIVEAAARRRVTVLPTVLYAPSWDAVSNPGGVGYPSHYGPYAQYLTALIGRYGPHGSFWTANPGIPKVPIRAWQIWNEPNIAYYWKQPFAASYVSLLRAAHNAIKAADPGARVVLGALTNLAWQSLGQVYKVPGARGLFDAVSVNGFTKLPADVILYMRLMRRAMDRFGDGRKPLIDTEISWPSAQGQTKEHYDFDTTRAGQARNIATLLPLIGSERASLGLAAFYYYTWIGPESQGNPDFDFAGLESYHDGEVTAKPALSAFRTAALALEGCKRKGLLATACVK
jgi:hypothetical protein